MITDTLLVPLVRFTAPLVWRSRARIARKLRGFSATEAGSALDMFRAVELTRDPELRRLFLHHALDEARHASMFKQAARALQTTNADADAYATIRARRQDLLEQHGLPEFLAFIHIAERDGQRQFAALAEHFDDDNLRTLFATLSKEEKFHVSYSIKQLMQRCGPQDANRALLKVRARRAWQTWRRAGRLLGDIMARSLITLVCVVVLPPFALIARTRPQRSAGWHQVDRSLDAHSEF